MSSNARELSGVLLTVQAALPSLHGKQVLVETDNRATQAYVNHLGVGPRRGKYFPVYPSTCSPWMRTIMGRVEIPKEFPGGSIRMAAASAAIDCGMPIDVVLSIGRWASWQVFDNFYNRS